MATLQIIILQEFKQIAMQRLEYLKQPMNYAQWTQYLLYMHYYISRLQVPDRNMYPSYKSKEDLEDDTMMYWMSMNCLILVISSFYILFYARVYESFGLFVRICQMTIASMSNFIVFLFFWMTIFLYLFLIVCGSQVGGDYKF